MGVGWPSAAAPAAHDPAEVGAVEHGRPTPLEELAAVVAEGDRDDPGRHTDVMRTLVRERWASAGPALPAVDGHDPEDVQYEARPAPAGDVDGDGRDDVFVTSWTYPGEGPLAQAFRGSDGEELWSVEASWDDGFAWPAGADLTGDGVQDLLSWGLVVIEESTESDCLPRHLTPCTQTDEQVYEYVVGVRSGADGAEAWQLRYDGVDRWVVSRSGLPPEYEYSDVITSTNGLMIPYLSGDHDGDGGRDLVLNLVDLRFEGRWAGHDLVVAGEETGSYERRYNTRAFLASGADGTTRDVRVVEEAPRVGELRPADDAGHGLVWSAWTFPDTSWECSWTIAGSECSVETGPVTGELELIDGASLATRWQRPLDAGDGVVPLADLDGDGHHDLFVDHWSYGSDGEPVLYGKVVDGAEGHDRWVREGRWWPQVLPPADGDHGGADVLHVAATAQDGIAVARAERLDGATGDVVAHWDIRRELGDADDGMTNAFVVGDVTGDGVPEIAWQALRLWRDEPCSDDPDASVCWYHRVRTDMLLRIDDGATGAVLHEAAGDGYGIPRRAGDLDGDGRDEVLLLQAGEGPLAWTAVGATGAAVQERWRSTYDVDTGLFPSGDHHGTGGGDLVRESQPFGSNDWAKVGAVDGRSGEGRWTRRYP